MKHWVRYCLLLLLAVSCGTARRAPVSRSDTAVIPPLENAEDIARSRARAEAVRDSVEQVRAQRAAAAEIPAPPPPPVSEKSLADQVLEYAETFLGVPYRLGAGGPKQFDCSGFTRYVFREYGFDLPHNSVAQFRECRKVDSFADLEKGDLVFFGARNNIRNIGHVGIVVDVDLERGMFRFIHASTSHGVEIQRSTHPYFMMRYIGAARVLTSD